MRMKSSKRYTSDKLQPKDFKLVLIFSPNGPHKTAFGFLILFFFRITIVPCG